MKTSFTFLLIIIAITICNDSNAQNIFPSNGRAGIYTTSPAASLHVRGGARIGTTANYTSVDSATGNLSFVGNASYKVAGNKYAFQYSGNSNYGLFFNSTNVQYEFRNGSAVPVFYVNANSGNGVFTGNLKIGAYTLPATDGTNGQVLKTNGSGVLAWSNDNGGAGSGWSLTGNAGTNASTNFIGTTDNQPLVFRVNNSRAGFIDNGSTSNTGFGYASLTNNTTGTFNIAFGNYTLGLNTSGSYNTGIGAQVLSSNTTGNYNTGVGLFSLNVNSTGNNNTATGTVSLVNNSTGSDNTAMGYGALSSNLSGNNNTAIGESAGGNNTTGNSNVALGILALSGNQTGNSNVAIGASALWQSGVGSNMVAIGDSALHNQTTNSAGYYFNTAVGSKALLNNTTGYSNTGLGFNAMKSNAIGAQNTAIGTDALYYNNDGSNNTAIGPYALFLNNNGNNNTAVGQQSLSSNTAGNYNTGIGEEALVSNSIGNYNTALGYRALNATTSGVNTAVGGNALFANTTGLGNTAIGYNADANSGAYNFSTAIGNSALITADNQVRIGNIGTTSIGGYVNWSNISDGRVKKNIKENVPGLAFINKLKPVTYNLNLDAADKIIQRHAIKNKNGKILNTLTQDDIASRKAKEQILYTGFVAQDVEKAAKSLNYDFSGVDAAKNDKDLYSLRYSDFVVPLVKAVQELSAKNDDLQKQVNELKAMITAGNQTSNNMVVISDASLDQNTPNPFSNTTTITYTLPQKFTSAQIIITDKNGKPLKSVNVSGNGKGSLNIDAAMLSSGAYQYSLYVDSKLIAAKQMLLQK